MSRPMIRTGADGGPPKMEGTDLVGIPTVTQSAAHTLRYAQLESGTMGTYLCSCGATGYATSPNASLGSEYLRAKVEQNHASHAANAWRRQERYDHGDGTVCGLIDGLRVILTVPHPVALAAVGKFCPLAHGVRLCGTTPQPGETVWRGDVEHIVTDSGGLRPVAQPEPPREPLRDRLLLTIMCGHCLLPRFAPSHLLVCPDRRSRVIMKRRARGER